MGLGLSCWAQATQALELQGLPDEGRLPQTTPDVAVLGRCDSQRLCVSADHLVYRQKFEQAALAGNVELQRGKIRLRAPRLLLDLKSHISRAPEGALLVGPFGTLQAKTLKVWGAGRQLDATDAVLLHPLSGGRRLRLKAKRVVRRAGKLWWARGVELSTCACGAGAAAFSVRAARATVDLESGALLISPVLRIFDLPVLWLPAFYFPLGERRSGLLLPTVRYSGRGGGRLSQPLYLTLGRSADLKLDLGGWLGRDPERVTDSRGNRVRPGPRGPFAGLELRYALSRGQRGHLEMMGLYDLQHRGRVGEGTQSRGARFELSMDHRSFGGSKAFGDVGHGLSVKAHAVTDAALVSDLELRLEERLVGYLRSSARAWSGLGRRGVVEIGARYLQDLFSPYALVAGQGAHARPLFGGRARGVAGTLQSAPEAHLRFLDSPLLGGLRLGGGLDFRTWVRPAGGLPEDQDWPHLHLHTDTQLGWSAHLGRWLAAAITGDLNLDLWQALGGEDASRSLAVRFIPQLQGSLRTGLEGEAAGWRHRLTPSLQLRAAPPTRSTGELPTLDAWDQGGTADSQFQLVAGLGQSLRHKALNIRLEVQQGWDLQQRDGSELMGRFLLERGLLRLKAQAAWNYGHQALSFARLGASVRGGVGRLSLLWVMVKPWSQAELRRGLLELYPAGAVETSLLIEGINELAISVAGRLARGWEASYSLRMEFRDPSKARRPQHVVGVNYVAPCRCLSVGLISAWVPGQSVPELRLKLDLAGLGG